MDSASLFFFVSHCPFYAYVYALCVHRCLIECRDEYKYNVEAVELLIRNHLVNMQQYDVHLAQVGILFSSFNLNQLRCREVIRPAVCLSVNGKWTALHGSRICHAVGEATAG